MWVYSIFVELAELTDIILAKEANWDYVEPKKRGEIVLNPQPSESPNDPLNWYVCMLPLPKSLSTNMLLGLLLQKWPFFSS